MEIETKIRYISSSSSKLLLIGFRLFLYYVFILTLDHLQRLFVEMVQMARRPFSSVQVEMNPINVPEEDVATIAVSDALGRRKKVHRIFEQ